MEATPVSVRRLLPEPGIVTAVEAVDHLKLGDLAPDHRPYMVLNIVATADGAATVENRIAPISNTADRQLFHELRTHVDAVLVGAGTARIERYGRLVRDPQRRARRVVRGLASDPLAIVVSRRLTLTPDLPLLADPHSRVVVITASDAELSGCAAQVSYLCPAPGAEVDRSTMFASLAEPVGLDLVWLLEWGSQLFARYALRQPDPLREP